MRVGIIAEGPTDQRVIEAIIKGVVNGGEGPAVELLVHDVRPEPGGPGGWGLVFAALRQGQHEEALQHNDYLVIQIDTDVCELSGFDVPRREAGRELDEPDLIARVVARLKREMTPEFLDAHGHRVVFAIAVNELECWLLPLVYENKKAAKTVGCFEALTQGLKDRKELGLLQRDGNSKAPRRYQDVSAPLRKPKGLANAMAHSPSLKAFVDQLSALAAAHRLGPPPIPPQ